MPGLNRVAEEFARKLVFTPARKGGAKPPAMDVGAMPVMTAVSAVPGIDLPKLDYKAPRLAPSN